MSRHKRYERKAGQEAAQVRPTELLEPANGAVPEEQGDSSPGGRAEQHPGHLSGLEVPPHWKRGQLLNVRNAGSHYNVTLLGEEYDQRYSERCLQFMNPAETQNFVSWWYSRESSNPLAR